MFGRVFSGTLQSGQMVRILGENYTIEDEEDSRLLQAGRLWIYNARYKVSLYLMEVQQFVLIANWS